MTIYDLCQQLERDHGFNGDLQAADDVVKDTAVKVYLTEIADSMELAEYLPGQVAWPRYMIDLLYSDPLNFAKTYKRQWLAFVECHKADLDEGEMIGLFFDSEALDTDVWLLGLLVSEHWLDFSEHMADAFYLHAERRLHALLEAVYDDLHLFDDAYLARGAV